MDPNTTPEDFPSAAEKIYGVVLRGGSLDPGKAPGEDEVKLKMHIATVTRSAAMIARMAKLRNENLTNSELNSENEEISDGMFYSATQDALLPYLDELQGASIPGDAYSIFTKLTKTYEDRFMQDMHDLNVLDPDVITRVTEYGHGILDFVDKIVKNDMGYVTSDGSVYFDIKAFEAKGHHYAKLEPWSRGNQRLQRDGEGSLSKAVEKRSPDDFALWKASQPGEPSWVSPWGKGRPGWHIECSAMASSQLGDQLDIHSGGIDLAFPHHDNELAQSEAYWTEHHKQWVNYFLHMGHLSIQGAKMSKSLKNFTTIREALRRGDWAPRSLRIVFLLGGWRSGIGITEELNRTVVLWEEKLNNFFLNAKDLLTRWDKSAFQQANPPETGLISEALKIAQQKVDEYLCDSFDTPGAMGVISELVSSFNSAEKSSLVPEEVHELARWITSIVNIFGLNGTASPDSPEIGWEGFDIPEASKRFIYPLSTIRDSLRGLAKSGIQIKSDELKSVIDATPDIDEDVSETAQPYARALSDFHRRVLSLKPEETSNISKEILALCDHIRDVDLFNIGIYLEDRDDKPALVRPVTKELLSARQEQEQRVLQKQIEKEKREKLEQEKLEKGKLSHLEMFRTEEFSAWDEDGLPTKDAAGEPINKSRSKKLRKDWERQKKAHETWLASQSGTF
jgi:cysteinyl-tRNA synthetase